MKPAQKAAMSSFRQSHPSRPIPTATSARSRAAADSRQTLLIRALLLAALLLAGFTAVLATAQPAHAHDELVSTLPAAGERLDAAPKELELTFSNALMDLGNQVQVLDADGRNWAEAALVLNRETLVQPLPAEMPNGEYSVRWRAVSSDGHPITGSYEFLVGADAVAGSAVTAVPAESGTAADGADTESTSESDDGGLPAWLVPGIVGGVVGLLLYAGYSVLSRRKRARTESSDR